MKAIEKRWGKTHFYFSGWMKYFDEGQINEVAEPTSWKVSGSHNSVLSGPDLTDTSCKD